VRTSLLPTRSQRSQDVRAVWVSIAPLPTCSQKSQRSTAPREARFTATSEARSTATSLLPVKPDCQRDKSEHSTATSFVSKRNFRSAGMAQSEWTRSIASRSLMYIITAQHWALFSTQSTMNLNMSVLMRRSGCWIPILFTNQQMTMFQATGIQFQACPELSFWRTWLGLSGSLWGDGFGMLIFQEHCSQIKWLLEILSPPLQRQCFANWWLRRF